MDAPALLAEIHQVGATVERLTATGSPAPIDRRWVPYQKLAGRHGPIWDRGGNSSAVPATWICCSQPVELHLKLVHLGNQFGDPLQDLSPQRLGMRSPDRCCLSIQTTHQTGRCGESP